MKSQEVTPPSSPALALALALVLALALALALILTLTLVRTLTIALVLASQPLARSFAVKRDRLEGMSPASLGTGSKVKTGVILALTRERVHDQHPECRG